MGEENLTAMFNENNTPFAKALGMVFTHISKDRLEAELEVTKERCTMPDVLHGGAIMALADNMGGVGAHLNMPPGATTATIESKTNFLRAIPVGQKVRAVTTPVNLGRTLQVWQTRISRADGKLAAIVTQTQLISTDKK
ncbi:MAG: PaaI family thioesterase [Parvularculaceae bacterium]